LNFSPCGLVPTLRVGMQPGRSASAFRSAEMSGVKLDVPTRSVNAVKLRDDPEC
jgi:hypothetical protein